MYDIKYIIIFDGVCNICDALVKFIIRRDSTARFKFTSAQSAAGRVLQDRHNLDAIQSGTMILIKNSIVYKESDAAVEISKQLDGAWKLLSVLRIVPKTARDRVYLYIARNRYKWFGKKEQCVLPAGELKNRFL
jgi:predicted DCC family thiol-disulfide oxidoreductase YuxK